MSKLLYNRCDWVYCLLITPIYVIEKGTMSIRVVKIQNSYAIRKGHWPFYTYFDLYTCDDWWEEDTPSFIYCITQSKALAHVMFEIMIEKGQFMKDYVNTGKPSAIRRFWRKHADDCRFWVMVGLIILAGGVF